MNTQRFHAFWGTLYDHFLGINKYIYIMNIQRLHAWNQ